MKIVALLCACLALGTASCAPAPAPVRQDSLQDAVLAGYGRTEVERDVAARLGPEPVRLAATAGSSILVSHRQGLPRPVQNADGSWGYEPPGANAMIRGARGWTGWSGTAARPVAAARAAEIERILADPAFWAEPNTVPPTCTDAGARLLLVRHAGRTAARQQSCGSTGLTGRLWDLVFAGPA